MMTWADFILVAPLYALGVAFVLAELALLLWVARWMLTLV